MNKRRKWRYNPIGEKYGMLTVLSEAERLVQPSGQKPRRFKCRCECGNETTVLGLHLVRWRITSCGCFQKKLNGESKSKICRAYKSMKERCKETYSESHLYFKKGITVCEEWSNDYFAFKSWALLNGFNAGLQLDRIDNSKGYYPENCRFVTPTENVNNRDSTVMLNYKGERIAIMDLFRKIGTPKKHWHTIRGRIKRGWEHNKAIDTPIRKGNYAKKDYKHLMT